MFWFDPTYVLVIIGVIICLMASANVNSTFNKYSKIKSAGGLTGKDVAARILADAGITDVSVEKGRGHLTDNYNPNRKVITLSEDVYDSSSLAAIGVAAHECGHVIQHHKGYIPLKIRRILVPAANIGSWLSWPIILLGVLFGLTGLVDIGIILFSAVLLFQIVTLPVEFDASGKALKILRRTGILYENEVAISKKVLNAAALTYVAAVISTLLQLLRLVLLFRRRND
ncbi:MAG: zinc metallopeptidase [Lachnospiraceae bacterium]|nr:zinc metallopeptidase [Lachnospiraceae bacterium]